MWYRYISGNVFLWSARFLPAHARSVPVLTCRSFARTRAAALKAEGIYIYIHVCVCKSVSVRACLRVPLVERAKRERERRRVRGAYERGRLANSCIGILRRGSRRKCGYIYIYIYIYICVRARVRIRRVELESMCVCTRTQLFHTPRTHARASKQAAKSALLYRVQLSLSLSICVSLSSLFRALSFVCVRGGGSGSSSSSSSTTLSSARACSPPRSAHLPRGVVDGSGVCHT